ncbi:MAG: hypothetical protein Q8L55_15365 [Phycisphaerales bacterium]|nr:hypothetical protein [Phycisphaerales bacterium]
MTPAQATSETAVPMVLELDRLRLRVDHRKGGGIVDAHWQRDGAWLPLIARAVHGEDPTVNQASFIMAPWCNRVRDAVFPWNGRRIALRPDPRDGTAMHGDVRRRAFEVLDRSPVSARLRFDSRSPSPNGVNFPWPFALETRFEIGEASITQEVTLTNAGEEPFPCGVGLHPYFPRRQGGEAAVARVIAPVGARYPTERCMPIGPARRDARCRWLCSPRRVPHHLFMDCYSGYQNVCVIEWARTRLTMTSSENHSHMVFFAPTNARGQPEPYFAVEPMTICADGFNMPARESGVTVLAPGASLKTWYRFEVEDR